MALISKIQAFLQQKAIKKNKENRVEIKKKRFYKK
jgi:hypothetical protein